MTMLSQKEPENEPLAIINRLLIQAIEAPNGQALQFLIANETHRLIPYDRAILWLHTKKGSFRMLAISGQAAFNTLGEFYSKLSSLINKLEDPFAIQVLAADKFSSHQETWAEYQRQQEARILWLPIFTGGELTLALWIEQWHITPYDSPPAEVFKLLSEQLLPGYGAAWGHFHRHTKATSSSIPKKWYLAPLALVPLAALFIIHLPLRIVAPCEVEPKDPIAVTAPLQGIIEDVLVEPNQPVDKGDILFKYDPRLYEQEYKIAKNEVSVIEADLSRALVLGVNEKQSLNDVAILKLKLEKAQNNLNLANDNLKKISVPSPVTGTAIIEDPDQWPGKPVRIGEKILTIADLSQTKIKLWIPENDNVDVDPSRPIQVILNVSPETTLTATLAYVSNEVTLNKASLPSYVAEAHWLERDIDVKPGLQGTSILYGKKVTLFYYLIRKPWIFVRHLIY